MDLWPHQARGIHAVLSAITSGERRICLTSPTGGGKTEIMFGLAQRFLDDRKRVVIYTNRKLLTEQTTERLLRAGIGHGVRASGYPADHDYLLQLASIQTEHRRSMVRGSQDLHRADLVLVDEGHLQTGATARAILNRHVDYGASYVLVTATPLDMGDLCTYLVVAGTKKELRECRAIVPAHHFAPDMPDLKEMRKLAEVVSESKSHNVIMRPGIIGRVLEHFRSINPDRLPSILFAPGVEDSIHFATEMTAAGVRSAHIDGNNVWVDGELHRSSPELREEILNESRKGTMPLLCNRFVLREGIDAKWLRHGIFATVFGSLGTYLQSGGRLLRSCDGKDHCTIQDHGGNYLRYGSLNDDWEWSLGMQAKVAAGIRHDRIRKGDLAEPWPCPQCGRVIRFYRCSCGFESKGRKPVRKVIMANGTLRYQEGNVYKERRICQADKGKEAWVKMYWRSRTGRGRRTFREAFAVFAKENHWAWPDPAWPFMPVKHEDQWRLVEEVPMRDLIGGSDG